jgi:hypothetical protein
MQKNNRFPSPEMKPAARFPSGRRTNPFTAFGRGSKRFEDSRRRSPLPINARAAALLDADSNASTQETRQNPFEVRKNSRFANLCDNREESSAFGRDRERGERRGNRFRGERRNYFQRRREPAAPKKPTFSMKEDDFPSLDGAPKKATVENKPMGFGAAADRGKKCASPPPRPKLPPIARLPRTKKVESGDESDGWNTEDERQARAADPSDNEEETNDGFWGEGGYNDQ